MPGFHLKFFKSNNIILFPVNKIPVASPYFPQIFHIYNLSDTKKKITVIIRGETLITIFRVTDLRNMVQRLLWLFVKTCITLAD